VPALGLTDLPPPPPGRTGWPWTEESPRPERAPARWPRVSIVTPSFNQSRFIEETLRSVLLQGYDDLEHIVVDGGSTDATLDVVRRYAPFLASWTSERDDGQADAINRGWRRSTGELLGWLNSDDVLQPGALHGVALTLVEHPEADLVYGDDVFMDAASNHSTPLPGEPITADEMVRTLRTPVPQPGFLMRRSVLERAGYLNPRWRVVLDRDFFVRVACVCRLHYRPGLVAAFRAHATSKSVSERRHWVTELPAMYRELFAWPDLPPGLRRFRRETMSRAHLEAAWCALHSDRSALGSLLRAVLQRPSIALEPEFRSRVRETYRRRVARPRR
jgi:glycosyltransferase involved in cell wall biosynthesis